MGHTTFPNSPECVQLGFPAWAGRSSNSIQYILTEPKMPRTLGQVVRAQPAQTGRTVNQWGIQLHIVLYSNFRGAQCRGACRRGLAQFGGQRGLLRVKGHLLFEPKRNNSLDYYSKGGISCAGTWRWESKKVWNGWNLEKAMGRSKKEARSWGLPGPVESGLDSREVPELV